MKVSVLAALTGVGDVVRDPEFERSMMVAPASYGVSTSERLRRVDALDLSKIKRGLLKLKTASDRKPWTEERAEAAVEWYRRFLKLTVKYPKFAAVPGVDIDEAWHQHIINTKMYVKDCEHALGRFLHHQPYGFDDVEMAWLRRQYDATIALYRQEFGCTPPFQDISECKKNCIDCYSPPDTPCLY